MSENQTAEQIEAEAKAQQDAARAAMGERNKGGRPRKTPEAPLKALTDDEAPEKTNLQRQALNKEAAEARRLERLKAARAEARGEVFTAEPEVSCRVTKKGDSKICTGEHVSGLGDLTYEHKEIISVTKSRALELEELGWVEIED